MDEFLREAQAEPFWRRTHYHPVVQQLYVVN